MSFIRCRAAVVRENIYWVILYMTSCHWILLRRPDCKKSYDLELNYYRRTFWEYVNSVGFNLTLKWNLGLQMKQKSRYILYIKRLYVIICNAPFA